MALQYTFVGIATLAIISASMAQFFGGRQNFDFGGFRQEVGYRSEPAWGSLSQSFDKRGFSTPIKVGAGFDFASNQGNGLSGSLGVVPGMGGQGSVGGKVNLFSTDVHRLSASAQHDRFLTKDLKPIGPETNKFGLKYDNANGANAFVSSSQTHGSPARATVGGSVPLHHSKTVSVDLTGQSTVGHGMKPNSQVGVEGSIKF